MSTWPPTLADFKVDLNVSDTIDDTRYALDIAAAIAFVQRACVDLWDFDLTRPDLPSPNDTTRNGDLLLGTLREAGRLSYRRRSPDGMVNMGDAGAGRVGSTDYDIARLLQIDRYSPPTFA